MSSAITFMIALCAAIMIVRLARTRKVFTGQMDSVEFLTRVTMMILLILLSSWTGGVSAFLQAVFAMIALAGVLAIVWAVRQERAPEDARELMEDRTWRSG